jgi:hypothetical protein
LDDAGLLFGYCTLPNTGVRSPTEAEDFPVTSASRPALGPTQPPVQWVTEALSSGGKERLWHDVDHSPPSNAEVKKE